MNLKKSQLDNITVIRGTSHYGLCLFLCHEIDTAGGEKMEEMAIIVLKILVVIAGEILKDE